MEGAAAPEHEQFGAGGGGQAHGAEAAADGGEHGVEDGFEDDGVGTDIVNMDGAEDGGGAHALAVENQRGVREVIAGVRDGGGDIVGFEVAERGIGLGGAARAAEVHQQDGSAQGVERAGLGQKAGFVGAVAVEEEHEGGGGGLRRVPGA